MKHSHIAGMAFTVWSGIYIVDIEYGINDQIRFQYGYQGSDGMIYKPLQTRTLEYDVDDDGNDNAYFNYKGMRICLNEIMIFDGVR